MLGRLADKLSLYLGEGGTALSEFEKAPFRRLLASIDKIVIRVNMKYKIFNGVTVNGDGALNGLAALGELTGLEDNENYIDAARRIDGMNDLERSGDIVLVMKDGIDDDFKRYTTGVACKSWHGSLNGSDSFVPLVTAYPGGNRSELTDILRAAEQSGTYEGNWIVPELIKGILENQYSGQ